MKFLQMMDDLLGFADANPGFAVSWYKSLSNIRVQALIDLERHLIPPAIPPVESLDE